MAKFDTSEENGFVHTRFGSGPIMMVLDVRDGMVPRYDLQDINGTVWRNVGEYELTPATREDIAAALAA